MYIHIYIYIYVSISISIYIYISIYALLVAAAPAAGTTLVSLAEAASMSRTELYAHYAEVFMPTGSPLCKYAHGKVRFPPGDTGRRGGNITPPTADDQHPKNDDGREPRLWLRE